MQQKSGVLYVVATPIGNLGDITERARKVLAEVDVVAAEDTRETLRLLNYLGISQSLVSYHEHNETVAGARIVAMLAEGKDVALVSDAGTPLVSDPGYDLVALARERGCDVVPVPGPSAAICALSAAGLPSNRFLFLGFPPRTSSQRKAWLSDVSREPGTLILYESPKRVGSTLADIAAVLGETRRVVVGRELTKRFETFLSGPPLQILKQIDDDPAQRLGEMVVLIEGCPESANENDLVEQERVMRLLVGEMPLKKAATLTAELTGGRKNALYKLGLELGLGRAD